MPSYIVGMEDKTTIEAYVLISVLKDIPNVMREIKSNKNTKKHIEEMSLVFGGADIIAKIKTPSVGDLHNIVINVIEKMEDVASTRTFIVDTKQRLHSTDIENKKRRDKWRERLLAKVID